MGPRPRSARRSLQRTPGAGGLDTLIAGEALARRVEHDPREVNADTNDLRATLLQKPEQTAVAGPKIQNTTSLINMLEQNTLSLGAVRESIRPVQITQDMLRGRPLVGRHAFIIGDEVGVFCGRGERQSPERYRASCWYRGSGVVAVDKGFGSLAHRCELSTAESVDWPIEAEQAIPGH
jgi:hypothetical protein